MANTIFLTHNQGPKTALSSPKTDAIVRSMTGGLKNFLREKEDPQHPHTTLPPITSLDSVKHVISSAIKNQVESTPRALKATNLVKRLCESIRETIAQKWASCLKKNRCLPQCPKTEMIFTQ
jgi:hypothetical protein